MKFLKFCILASNIKFYNIMKRLLTTLRALIIAIVFIFTSCNKSLDNNDTSKNTNQLKTTELLDHYHVNNFNEIVTIFTDANYLLEGSNDILNELNTIASDENVSFIDYELILFKEGSYNFVSSSSDNLLKVSFILEKIPNKNSYRVTGTSCTCSGCADGCSPRRHNNGDCYCTTCTFVGSGVNCTKTESFRAINNDDLNEN